MPRLLGLRGHQDFVRAEILQTPYAKNRLYPLGQIKSRPFMPPHTPPQCLAGVRVVAQALADGALVQGLVVALQPEHLQAQGLQAGQIGWALCAGV